MKTLEYQKDDITVLWKPDLCKHAGICVKMLPHVYNPKARPWIDLEKENSPEAIINQVNACPSGALTYIKKEQ